MASIKHSVSASARPPWGQRLGRGFQALSVPNYRLFWSGQLVSWIGSWMQTTAQAWLVLQLTSSPFEIGLVTTLQFLPFLLFSLFGGLIADRVSKRRLVLVTQTAGLVQAVVFSVLIGSGSIQLWHIYVLALLQGIVSAVDNPARQTFTSELVGRDLLANAVALNSMQFNTARILGPALAGIVIARFGVPTAIYINAVSFLAALASLLMMDPSKLIISPSKTKGSAVQRIVEGLNYSLRTPRILLIMVIVAVIGTFGFNYNVILSLLAGFVLHTDSAGFGIIASAIGVGSLFGAFNTAFAKRVSFRRLLLGSALFAVMLIAMALSSWLPLSAVFLAGLGFAGVLFATTANTLVQLGTPDELRGRVLSLYLLLFIGSTPLGSLIMGSLSNVIGVQPTLALCGTTCLVGVIGVMLFVRRHRSIAE